MFSFKGVISMIEKFREKIRYNLKEESGQAMVLVSLLMTVLLGFTALAIDLGYGYHQKSDLQTAADAAALATASQMVGNTNAKLRTIGKEYATKNLDDTEETTVTVNLDRIGRRAQVTIRQPAKNFFSGIFSRDKRYVSATATSKYAVEWDGEVLPFLNLDANYAPGTTMTVWDKVFSGDFGSINDYEIHNANDPNKIYFKVDYMNGVELKKGTVAKIKQEIGWIFHQNRRHVYILSISQEVYDSGKVLLANGTYRPINKMKNKDIVDPSQLVLVECKFTAYSESAKLLVLLSEAVYDFNKGEYPPDYECPGMVAAKLIK